MNVALFSHGKVWSAAAAALVCLMTAVGFAVGTALPDEPRILLLIDEDEYETAETLPAFARSELESRDFRITVIHGEDGSFPGLVPALDSTDLLILSVRRRTPPQDQLDALRRYLAAGNPVLAIRTSSHAFALRGDATPPAGQAVWPAFDVEILGGRYEDHYGNDEGTQVFVRPEAGGHPILSGVRPASFQSSGTLYRSRDLAPTTEVLLYGRATDRGEEVTEPVAWTNGRRGGRIFYTSLGHPDDFDRKPFRRMLVNAVYWLLGADVPSFGSADSPEVERYMDAFPKAAELSESGYLPPVEALKAFRLAPGLEQDLVASEPMIYQPLDISFDHRGRLWVVQYNQYPHPEGLQIRAYDEWLRAVFDTIPAPPPRHEPGADRITVLEDADGDGHFEHARDVITGLNLATSVELGRGGIWVLNPPYLLKYPDPDGDGEPDGVPEVHLSGFGLEDTHAVANSLQWGPDGWLYGAQGSTTTADVSSDAAEGVRWSGQAIWRYHPETRVFELFAEGGGNTFNVEFDAKGRLFSGHNGGNARGFHYKQGAYYQKNWGKHGALTNPYALGYFSSMPHEGDGDRFTHAEIVYEAEGLPPRFAGKLISINPLHGRVEVSRLDRVGSTFRTTDTERMVETEDEWYRPVDIQDGPDGAVYVADWYDARINHVDPRDNWHRASGRIYRIRAAEAAGDVGSAARAAIAGDSARVGASGGFDLSRRSTDELIDLLSHPDRWFRQEALRLLGDRRDSSAVPRLAKIVRDESGQLALEALWGLNLSGGFDEDFAASVGLEHSDPHVRRWTVRLLGDAGNVSPLLSVQLGELARTDPDVDVRSQLAASAKRLPAVDARPILGGLLERREDADDPQIPLQIWWAIESKAESGRDVVLDLFDDGELWEEPLVTGGILQRLAQRYAMEGGEENLGAAARLLQMAPDEETSSIVVSGILEGLRGRDLEDGELPRPLEKALRAYEERVGSSDLAFGVRRGNAQAVQRVLEIVADRNAESVLRLSYLDLVAETRPSAALPVLFELLEESGPSSAAIQQAALHALAGYDDPGVGREVAAAYPVHLRAQIDVRMAAQELLTSRASWAPELVELVVDKRVRSDEIPPHVVDQLRRYDVEAAAEIWRDSLAVTGIVKGAEMERIRQVLQSGSGHAVRGKDVYEAVCGACHVLHGEGGRIGPELTGYDRDDVSSMILSIVDPDAYVREGYVQYLVSTRDGRSLSGFLADRSGDRIVLRAMSGTETILNEEQIEEMHALSTSLMPGGLLAPLKEQEIRDLFAYLRSDAPIENP